MKFIDHHIDKIRVPYLFVACLPYVLYFVAFFGIRLIEDSYIHALNVATQTFIVLFLLYRFHPFRTEIDVKPIDIHIILGCAILMGANLVLVEYAKLYPTYATLEMF